MCVCTGVDWGLVFHCPLPTSSSFPQEGAEHQVRDLVRQIASLKSRLDSTEATQKDFVQLSQSLQVQYSLTTREGGGEVDDPINAHLTHAGPCLLACNDAYHQCPGSSSRD